MSVAGTQSALSVMEELREYLSRSIKNDSASKVHLLREFAIESEVKRGVIKFHKTHSKGRTIASSNPIPENR